MTDKEQKIIERALYDYGKVTAPLLMRKLKCDYKHAMHIMKLYHRKYL